MPTNKSAIMGFLSEVYGYVSSLREKGGATLTVSQMTAPYIAALVANRSL